MAETKQDEAEPSVTTGTTTNQTANNAVAREQDVLQEVLGLISATVNENSENATLVQENRDLRGALTRMAGLLRDKSGSCLALEKRVEALNLQVKSLKDVVAITKDMLNIRNVEVQHLTADMDAIQVKMEAQRQRHNEMIGKLENALSLNGKLKTEYETQLKLFQELKEKYEQRALILEGMSNNTSA